MNAPDFEPGPLADVECRASDDRWTLVFVRQLRHPPEKVWAALTDPAQLREWAPFTADRDLGSAGDATLTMLDADESVDLPASVVRAERPTLLEYTWGTDLLRWELTPTGSGTRLTLRHTVDNRDWVPKVAAGWHLCLVVAEHLLDGRPIGAIRGADARNYGWDQLHDAYAEKLGIAGTGWPEDDRQDTDDAAVRTLYGELLAAWNRRDPQGFAALFAPDGELVGFDGNQVSASDIVGHLGPIFEDHPTATYVAKVRGLRPLGRRAVLLRAVVGMVPPGQTRLNSETNAVQSLIAERHDRGWRIVHFQNTPARYHGRPDLVERHTAELQQLVDAQR